MIGKVIEFCAKHRLFVLSLVFSAVLAAGWCLKHIALDAIPDLSDTQVIIYTKWDRSPDIIEDQITYPIVSSLLGAPRIKAVRGISDFGSSFVYAIFEDGTDLYWARSRITEYLSQISSQLPKGAQTRIGPDATSVGWIFQYALVDDSNHLNSAELRSLQDFQLKFHLQSVPGVAEVASLGGMVKQYQINLDPNLLNAFKVSMQQVLDAVQNSNTESSARVFEIAGREYMLRGRGYVKNLKDLEDIAVSTDPDTGTPVLLKNLGRVELGPDMRRGVSDFDGLGDTAGGIVIMRQGENVLNVIEAVQAKLAEIKASLPQGVRLVTTYDRSELVKRSINTLTSELIFEMLIVSLVILFFLWHFPSAFVPIVTIPVSVLLAFIPMYFWGITSNIMSLAGIAISIGVLVDGAIVEVENAYKKLEHWQSSGAKGDYHQVRLEALKEVGPSVFFSLLVISVSFLPIFTLLDQEGRLFTPLAISKTITMSLAALLAITLDPALRMLFTRMQKFDFKSNRPGARLLQAVLNTLLVGNYRPEEKHPVSKVLHRIYEPAVHWVLKNTRATVLIAIVLVLSTVPVYFKLGSEFMPPLDEESLLYMPTAFPGMSVSEAKRILQAQDAIIKQFPEVLHVHGKAGRAETATDPAPLSMFETVVTLKPKHEWPSVDRFYSDLPHFLHPLFSWILPPQRTRMELEQALNEKLKFAGMPNIWTMPIKNRIDMLSTGIRTPVGIKVLGPDLKEIQKISEKIESIMRKLPGTRNVFAERTSDGYYLDIVLDRPALARYGIAVQEAQTVIGSAIGGENVSQTIEGRARYPINVRYMRDFRDDFHDLKRVLVSTPTGAQIPLGQLAEINLVEGPAMIRNEGGLLAGYVYIDTAETDLGGYVQRAKQAVNSQLSLPPSYTLAWSGQFENILRVKDRLKLIVPLTLFLVMVLLYLNTKSFAKTLIVILAVPFSLVGSLWLLYFLGYHISIGVWVGMIALMGLDAETGVFMLMYLDLAFKDKKDKAALNNEDDLKAAIVDGAVKRLRPKLMTVSAAFAGLLPIMFSSGTGSDLMRRIAAPMIGGLFSSFLLELLVYPALYFMLKKGEITAGALHENRR